MTALLGHGLLRFHFSFVCPDLPGVNVVLRGVFAAVHSTFNPDSIEPTHHFKFEICIVKNTNDIILEFRNPIFSF